MDIQKTVDFASEIKKINKIIEALDNRLYIYWKENFTAADFQMKINNNGIKKLDSLDLRNQLKEKFPGEDVSNLRGIYLIYRNNELFYIGEGKILSRLRRHCNKPYRSVMTSRISQFQTILDDDTYVITFKMKDSKHVKQRVMFETILTANLLPKYIMNAF